jgi:hypothetical protein
MSGLREQGVDCDGLMSKLLSKAVAESMGMSGVFFSTTAAQ